MFLVMEKSWKISVGKEGAPCVQPKTTDELNIFDTFSNSEC